MKDHFKSISDSLRHSAAKVASNIGTAARLAALRAKIEKLKLVDLNAAYYALGKKCYDLGLHRDQFPQQFESIGVVERQIEERSKDTPTVENETTGDKVKRMGAKALSETEAAALRLKMKHRLTQLGKEIAKSSGSEPELQEERANIANLDAEIKVIEATLEKLATEFNDVSSAWSRFSDKTRRRWLVGTALAVVLLGLCVLFYRNQTSKALPSSSSPATDASFVSEVPFVGMGISASEIRDRLEGKQIEFQRLTGEVPQGENAFEQTEATTVRAVDTDSIVVEAMGPPSNVRLVALTIPIHGESDDWHVRVAVLVAFASSVDPDWGKWITSLFNDANFASESPYLRRQVVKRGRQCALSCIRGKGVLIVSTRIAGIP